MERLSLAEFLTVLRANKGFGQGISAKSLLGFLRSGKACFWMFLALVLLKAMPAGGLDKIPVKPMEQLAAVSYVTMSGSLQPLDDWDVKRLQTR